MDVPGKTTHEGSALPQDRIHSESFLHMLMARQLKLSITCAVMFLVALLVLPLAKISEGAQQLAVLLLHFFQRVGRALGRKRGPDAPGVRGRDERLKSANTQIVGMGRHLFSF